MLKHIAVALVLICTLGCGGGGGSSSTSPSTTNNQNNNTLPSTPTWIAASIGNATDPLSEAVAIDKNGKTHISYIDQADNKLKYANNLSGAWTVSVIDDAFCYSSMAIDKNCKVHLAYYDYANKRLKYANNKLGVFQSEIIDSNNAGIFNSIGVDANGAVHICYFSHISTNNIPLMYATNSSGQWSNSIIETTPYSEGQTSLTIDVNGKVHVAYQYILPSYNMNQRIKHASNAQESWSTEFVSPSNNVQQAYPSIAVDNNNNVHIACYNANSLLYLNNVSGSWSQTVLDTPAWYSSIAVDSNGKVHISYGGHHLVGSTYYNDLRYITNKTGTWVSSAIATSNNGDVGGYDSIALDSNGNPYVTYYNAANNVVMCAWIE